MAFFIEGKMAEEKKKIRRSFKSLPRRAQNAAFASMRASGKIKSKTRSKSKRGNSKKDYSSIVKKITTGKETFYQAGEGGRIFANKKNAIKFLKNKGREMPDIPYETVYRKGKAVGSKKVDVSKLYTYMNR